MPPRPFPYPLRLGADICAIQHIRRLLTSTEGPSTIGVPHKLSRFLRRVFTPPETLLFEARFGPAAQAFSSHTKKATNRVDQVAQYLAGRFAAKEACRKACVHMDPKRRNFQRILILPNHLSEPQRKDIDSPSVSRPRALVLDREYEWAPQRAAEGMSGLMDGLKEVLEKVEGQWCEVSITHDGQYAMAMALVPDLGKEMAREEEGRGEIWRGG